MADPDANQRKHITDSNFAEAEERKGPMEGLKHARNALSRVARHGGGAEEVRETSRRSGPPSRRTEREVAL